MSFFIPFTDPYKPTKIHLEWNKRVTEEFFRQGDDERERNMPITPMCDRMNSNVPKITLGFIDYVVTPMFQLWTKIIPEAQPMLEQININRQHWENEVSNNIRTRLNST